MGCLLPLLAIPVGFGALVIGLFVLASIPDPNSPVNASNAARLKPGMTYDEVVAIVGDPAPPSFDGEDQAKYCRHGSDTCSWSPCPLCDSQLFLTFERGVLVSKSSEGL
jgi:hypothetical protein